MGVSAFFVGGTNAYDSGTKLFEDERSVIYDREVRKASFVAGVGSPAENSPPG